MALPGPFGVSWTLPASVVAGGDDDYSCNPDDNSQPDDDDSCNHDDNAQPDDHDSCNPDDLHNVIGRTHDRGPQGDDLNVDANSGAG